MKVFLLLAVAILAIGRANSASFVDLPKLPSMLEILTKMKQTGKEGSVKEQTPIFEVDFADWWDGFFDAYLFVMEKLGLDRMEFPKNMTMKFEKEFLGTIFQGNMTFADRFVAGVQTLHRTGPAKLTIGAVDEEEFPDIYFRFTGQLGVDFVSVGSKMIVQWMELIGLPELEATVTNIQISFAGRMQTDCVAEIEVKEVVVGGMDINIKGLEGPLKDIADFLTGLVETFLKEGISDIFETGMRWIWEDLVEGAKEIGGYCDSECPKTVPKAEVMEDMPSIAAFQHAMKMK